MRLNVLGSADGWYFRDLKRAASSDETIIPVSFSDLRCEASRHGACFASGEIDLSAANATLVRSMPAGSLEQIIFRMDVLAELAGAGHPVVNAPRALEVAIDKFLATERLRAAGLSVPATCVCQTVDDAMRAFEALGGDVVVKPLFGGEGRGIARLTDEAIAWRTAKLLTGLGAVLYVQQFIEHDHSDLRLLVIGRRVLGIRRRNPLDWRTNVSRGATAEPLEVTPELAAAATSAAAAVGAEIAGVDLLPGGDGTLYALEVNAVPGWKAVAETLQVDVARMVLDYLQQRALGKE